MEQMEQRITALEKLVRAQRRRERIGLAVLAMLVGLGASPAQPREVRAESFTLIDSKGRECGRLASGPHGGSLDLQSVHGKAGLHAEAGELRISEIHGDDVLYVGMLGTRCYGLLSVEPPSSAQVKPPCSVALRVQSAAPSLFMQSGAAEWGVQLGPQGAKITPVH